MDIHHVWNQLKKKKDAEVIKTVPNILLASIVNVEILAIVAQELSVR